MILYTHETKEKSTPIFRSTIRPRPWRTGKGVVVITGCSHTAICNIVKQTKKVTAAMKPSWLREDFTCPSVLSKPAGTVDCFRQNPARHIHFILLEHTRP